MPVTLPSSTLSASENRALQYVLQIISKTDAISSDYLEQELDNIEEYHVSRTTV